MGWEFSDGILQVFFLSNFIAVFSYISNFFKSFRGRSINGATLLKNRKAPFPHSIRNRALKLLPDIGISRLAIIFQSQLRLQHYPTSWKNTDDNVIPKFDKDLKFSQNYRPTSHLPTSAKVYEKFVPSRVEEAVEDHIQDEEEIRQSELLILLRTASMRQNLLAQYFQTSVKRYIYYFSVTRATDGVPQGSVLFLFLFNIYKSDLPKVPDTRTVRR